MGKYEGQVYLSDLIKHLILDRQDKMMSILWAGCLGRYKSKERIKSVKLTYREITCGVPNRI